MIETMFQFCVDILVWLARPLGVTYETVNVCMLWPTLTVWMAVVIWRQKIQTNQLKHEK